jgi:CHASE3 domain sensor protein
MKRISNEFYIWVLILFVLGIVSFLLRNIFPIFDWLYMAVLLIISLLEINNYHRQKEKIREAERKKQELDAEIKRLETPAVNENDNTIKE